MQPIDLTTELVNAKLMAALSPATFFVPTPKQIASLKVGDLVKVKHATEVFWVILISFDDDLYMGAVINHLQEAHPFTFRDLILFNSRHIYDIYQDRWKVLTKSILETMPDNCWIAQGETLNHRLHKDPVKWVAVRGGGYPDWSIYYHRADKSFEFISTNGDKITSLDLVKELVPCNHEALALYRL